jgi:uncharacterized protein with NAD-binding domain and iron-sulfur cluster
MTTTAGRKRQIAILGGGVGAMSAAFALTSQPGWQDNYEVTVYQMGWRLGGKGASGRNADYGQRIEEHGLHIWFGFYENAFRVMREAYMECTDKGLYPTSPFKSWQDAYKPQNLLTCMEDINGTWKRWDFDYPTNDRLPGDGDDKLLLRPWDYVVELLRWLTTWHDESLSVAVKAVPSFLISSVEQFFIGIKDVAAAAFGEARTAVGTAIHHALFLADSMPDDPHDHTAAQQHTLLAFVDHYRDSFRAAIAGFVDRDDDLRRHWILLDLVVSMVRGIIAEGIIYRGFDIIDNLDARAWLVQHGCTSAYSAPVTGMYDLVFAYLRGDIKQANFAAGTALRATLRILFCFKGSLLWKMQAGMGDTVFSPIYLALQKRGVKFRFFHRVRNLGLSADKTAVDQIDIDVQATVKGSGEYNPIVDVKGLPCWPSTPKYDLLVEGEELKKSGANLESAWCPPPSKPLVLKRGTDFDDIVMGISLGGLPYVASELIAANWRWAKMVANLATVQTQAVQLWMNRDADGLGWVAPERAVVGAYVEPLDTWADMTQVLDKEDQPASLDVRNIAYFCGVIQEDPQAPFTDCKFPAQQEARVKAQALDFLNKDVGPLWPKALAAGTEHIDWNVIADPAGLNGPARIDHQFFRVNIDPTERYALSLAGSTPYRLRADQAGFTNVFLAGDWTYNGINLGCVEAGAISGLQASRAICGFPKVIPGESDVLS